MTVLWVKVGNHQDLDKEGLFHRLRKDTLGRGSAVRVEKGHQGGGTARTAEWGAERNIDRGLKDRGPTDVDIQVMKQDNPSDYNMWKRQGKTDAEIYGILNKRQ